MRGVKFSMVCFKILYLFGAFAAGAGFALIVEYGVDFTLCGIAVCGAILTVGSKLGLLKIKRDYGVQ